MFLFGLAVGAALGIVGAAFVLRGGIVELKTFVEKLITGVEIRLGQKVDELKAGAEGEIKKL
jgi:hypothetical protein